MFISLTSLVQTSAARGELNIWLWAAGITGSGFRSVASCPSSRCLSGWSLSLLTHGISFN